MHLAIRNEIRIAVAVCYWLSEARIDLLVSKWEIAYQREGVKTVDVTDKIVVVFDPDEKTKELLESIRATAPVSGDNL